MDYKALDAKIDRTREQLSAQIEATNERNDITNEKLSNLDRKVTDIGSKLTALLWIVGGLGTFITLTITVGKALHWF